ncbi:hypothetical protein, partial [uncultured Haemophilus sp.]|uniref:hypothetical protein n=1 Tax=uncultured Haemophilus sp. TaxID=237779 RepID=UPI00258750E0
LKNKKKRRTAYQFKSFTTVRRCVGCIIEKNKTHASVFCKKFKKPYRLFTFESQSVFLSQILFN